MTVTKKKLCSVNGYSPPLSGSSLDANLQREHHFLVQTISFSKKFVKLKYPQNWKSESNLRFMFIQRSSRVSVYVFRREKKSFSFHGHIRHFSEEIVSECFKASETETCTYRTGYIINKGCRRTSHKFVMSNPTSIPTHHNEHHT